MIDQLADDFKQMIRLKPSQTIETFLAEHCVAPSADLLEALLLIDLEVRSCDDGNLGENQLLRRFPEFGDAVRRACAAYAHRHNIPPAVARSRLPEPEPTFIPASVARDTDRSVPIEEDVKAIGAYDITGVLGKGGMGIVYSAVHRRTNEPFAIKLVLPQLHATQQALRIFLREASILTGLKHPHIVASREFGLHENRPYFVMEYVPVVDLEKILKTQSPVRRIRVVCKTVCRVLEGLQYAHDQGIVHRDVKPPNILVFRRGDKLNCKLADFGLAKRFADAGLSGLTGDNELRGTIAYMPPEQLADSRSAGPAADIYSVGVCLHRMLSKQLPYPHSAGETLMRSVIQHEILPLREHFAEAPPELEQIVGLATQRNPGDRFTSARAMHDALTAFVNRQV